MHRRNLIVKNAEQVVTCRGSKAKKGAEMSDLGLITHGAIRIEDGVIVSVGDTEEVMREVSDRSSYEVIDAKGKCVLPGFVDSHTHLVFGGYREEEFQWRLRGDSYMSIMERGGGIVNTVTATRQTDADALYHKALPHLDAMFEQGVTTVEAKSGYGLDLDTELKQLQVAKQLDDHHPISIFPTFMGAHATPAEFKGREDAFIDYMIREVLPRVKEQGIARAVDIFTEKGVFDLEQSRRYLQAAKDLGYPIKVHADEIVSFAGTEFAVAMGALSADHLLQSSDEGIKALSKGNTVATLLPCTAFSLKEPFARARHMIDSGVAVALGSDLNPGSCFSQSIPLMFALACIYMNMTVEEAVSALTINGAAAIGMADRIGSIEPGKEGDLAILRYPSYKFLSYHFAMNIVETTVKSGVPYSVRSSFVY